MKKKFYLGDFISGDSEASGGGPNCRDRSQHLAAAALNRFLGQKQMRQKKNAFHKQKREWKCTSSSKSENCALTHVLGSDPDKSSHFIGRILKRESKMLRDAHVIVDV